jgi:hypothetical protein
MLHPSESFSLPGESSNLRFTPVWRRDAHIPTLSAFQSDGLKPGFGHRSRHCGIMRRTPPECQDENFFALFKLRRLAKIELRLAPSNRVQIGAMFEAKHRRTGMEPIDLLADTRRYLDAAIRQLAAIEAGTPIAKPLTREQAINIVTEQIGLFESVLRRYGLRDNADRK